MTHTFECSIAHSSRILQRQAYLMMWPRRCERCCGSGGFMSSFDPSPSGVSLSPGSMEEYEACFECVERNVCPRCAHVHTGSIGTIIMEEAGMCLVCGWAWDRDETHEPPPYECGCWYALEFDEDPGIVGELGSGQHKFWDVPW